MKIFGINWFIRHLLLVTSGTCSCDHRGLSSVTLGARSKVVSQATPFLRKVFGVLQNLCNKALYCCGPDYCSVYPLLYFFFQIRNGLGSSLLQRFCPVQCNGWFQTPRLSWGASPQTYIGLHTVQPRVHSAAKNQLHCNVPDPLLRVWGSGQRD